MTDNERTEELKNAEPVDLARAAVKLLLSKKGIDVKMYDVCEYTSVTDYYVNVTARSSTHVGALSDDLVDDFSKKGTDALRVEGKRGNSWILIDFGSLIVNVFDSESRSFYNFDRLLPQEAARDISEIAAEVDKQFE